MVPKKFLTFACTGQSGHTIIAAILDAHPNAMISEEKMVIRKIAKGRFKTPDDMFEHVMYDSRTRVQGKNSYRRKIGTIEGQGQYEGKLEVLGDKCGWDAIGRYKDRGVPNTAILDFEQSIGVPVYVIHALRNPYDIIANWYLGKTRGDMEGAISHYEDLAHATQKVYYESELPDGRILQVRNEDLCANPFSVIVNMCSFLGLEWDNTDHVPRCAKIIFKNPNRRRDEISWCDEDLKRISDIIDRYSFLEGYDFER